MIIIIVIDSSKIANIFKTFFINTVKNISKSITSNEILLSYVKGFVNSKYIPEFTEYEVTKTN